jgi:tRNA(Ser,Leu) C12 N-acetylase TAN1
MMATDIKKFKSIKDVKPEDIFQRSKDGKTLILNDGTKVSDELIAQANRDAAALEAATKAAKSTKVDLEDPDFVAKVEAIATAAAQKVINAKK